MVRINLLKYNKLQNLSAEIGNLRDIKILYLSNNKLENLPVEILKIKKILLISDSSYNINIDNKILIFGELSIKLPFDCVIKYY